MARSSYPPMEIEIHEQPPVRHWHWAAPCAVSLVVHFAGVALAVWGGEWVAGLFLPDEHARLAGEHRVVHVASAASQAALESPTVEIEPTVEPVDVTPREVKIEKQRFVETATATPAELLAAVESPEVTPAEMVRALQAAEVIPTPSQPPELKKTPPSNQASSASLASLPQSPGEDTTIPVRALVNRPPRYPEMARLNGWQGTVLLKLVIDATGAVTEVSVSRTSGHSLLDAEAANAVRSWRFEPARRRGIPVATEEYLPVRFRL